MSFTFEVKVMPCYVLAICEGSYELARALVMFKPVFKTAAEHKLSKILVDCRKITGNLSTFQRYELYEQVVKIYFQERGTLLPRLALLENEPLFDPDRFGPLVAMNRGMPVQVSVDLQESMKWLGIESAGE
jgi:hypothetical protein